MHTLIAAALPALLAVGLLASADADPSGEARLDELHRARPAAAVLEQHREALGIYREAERAARFEAFLTAAVEAEAAAASPTVVASTSASSTPAAPAEDWLSCTRRIESNGDYGAVSSGGTYRGAYQFHQGTWDRTASDAGRHDLVGRDPATASQADQDAMATHLYAGGSGASHWGGRCT